MGEQVICYEYITSWNKFNEGPVPLKEEFFTELSNIKVTDK